MKDGGSSGGSGGGGVGDEVVYLFDHSNRETLLEAAELAAIAPPLIDGTVAVGQTDVLGPFLDGPLEESFATLAGANAVVLAGRVVAADAAQLRWRLGSTGGRSRNVRFAGAGSFHIPHHVHDASAHQVHSEILKWNRSRIRLGDRISKDGRNGHTNFNKPQRIG